MDFNPYQVYFKQERPDEVAVSLIMGGQWTWIPRQQIATEPNYSNLEIGAEIELFISDGVAERIGLR